MVYFLYHFAKYEWRMRILENNDWSYYLLYIRSQYLNGFYVVGAYSKKQMYAKAYHNEFHRNFRSIDRSISPANQNVTMENFKKTIVEFYEFDKTQINRIWDEELRYPRPD